MHRTDLRTTLRKLLVGLAVVNAILAGLLAGTAHSAAAATSPSVSVNASPEPIRVTLHPNGSRAGAIVRVSGKVGSRSSKSRNAGRVKFYFRNYRSTSFVYMGRAASSSVGYYGKHFKQKYSGEWKVKFLGNSYRAAAWSAGDFVEALAKKYVNRAVFSMSSSSDYIGPPVNLPNTSVLSTSIALSCDSPYPFINVSWHGAGGDYESIWYEPSSDDTGTTQYMYPTTRTGHFEVSSQSSCLWTVKIIQRTRIYVRV